MVLCAPVSTNGYNRIRRRTDLEEEEPRRIDTLGRPEPGGCEVAIDGVVAPDALVGSDFTTLVGVSIVFCLTILELKGATLLWGCFNESKHIKLKPGNRTNAFQGRKVVVHNTFILHDS
jgi:hypothetical protein